MKTVICIVGLLLSINSFAFETELQSYVLKSNWRAAERTLREADVNCRRQDGADKCADTIAFSRAWMYSRRAEQSTRDSERIAYFERSRDAYFTVLQNNPSHLPTIDNLILVLEKLKDRSSLERLLPTLEGLQDNQRTAKLVLTIANLYRDAGNHASAFAYANRAYQIEPSHRAIAVMVESFLSVPGPQQGQQLWQIAKTEETIEQRKTICEAIINQRSSVDPALWESAAINWVAWLGRERRLTTAVIEQSIDVEHNPEFQELLAKYKDQRLGMNEEDLRVGDMTLVENREHGWWNATKLRTWAFTIGAWSEGHNQLIAGNVKAANSLWLAALQYAPPTRYYNNGELKNRWAISLELATDIARLQQLYKEQLDANGEVFASIERLLFFSKAQAYEINDLESIQRHHTLMGKMYADLGIFKKRSSNDYRSAEFQLENAIKTAKRRTEQSGVDDPQPALEKLLADGYSCKLRGQNTNCTKDNAKAQLYYTESARDFIKLDAVTPAQKSLEALKEYQSTPTDEVKKLETIINLRASITRDQLQNGRADPDIVLKQIDMAAQWQALGEDNKARESVANAVNQGQDRPINSDEIYQTLKRGDVEAAKKISRERMVTQP